MLMDDKGCIYWLRRQAGGNNQVLRQNPKKPLTDNQYVKSVYAFNSDHVFFFQFFEGLFYIMDKDQQIKVLDYDLEKDMLK